MARHTGNTTTDHDTIRKWAEERGARPACVKGTGGRGDTGMIRLDFPGYSGADSLQSISWDDWFRSFDDNDLALVYQDRTASGQKSNFNKLVGRETAAARARGDNRASRHHGTRKKTSTRTRATGRAKSSSGRSRTASSGRSTSRSRSGASKSRSTTRGTTRSATRGGMRSGTRSASARRGSKSSSRSTGTRSRSSASTRGRSASSSRGGSRSRSGARSSKRS